MHKYRRYGPDKLNSWPFLSFGLNLQPTWTTVSNDTSTPQGEQLCHIILKSKHKCRSYGPDKCNLWSFYQLTFKCDHDCQPTWTRFKWHCYSSRRTTKLCQILWKSMHKCRSNGPDKLNLRPLYQFTFKCDCDLHPTWTNGMATLQGEQLCQIILKSKHKCRSYGSDKLNLCDLQVWPWPSTYLKMF